MAAVYENHPMLFGNNTNIRLVELQSDTSAHANTSISCKLHVVSVDTAPDYAALSYVWGNAVATKTILLDGQPFPVRDNLWDFLTRAREDGHVGFFWIDAICVNQEDIPERNHQVVLMGKIYSNAAKVIAWLGLGPENVANAVRGLKDSILMDSNKTRDWSSFTENVVQLTKSDYWTRLWIIQEFVLSKQVEIWCGSEKMNNDVLAQVGGIKEEDWKGASSDQEHHERGLTKWADHAHDILCFRYYLGRRELDPSFKDFFSFNHLFSVLSSANCSDARDRAYATLSLVNEQELQDYPVKPDYTISPSELFVQLFDRRCRQLQSEIESWVDDFRYWIRLRIDAEIMLGQLGLRSQNNPVVMKILEDIREGTKTALELRKMKSKRREKTDRCCVIC